MVGFLKEWELDVNALQYIPPIPKGTLVDNPEAARKCEI